MFFSPESVEESYQVDKANELIYGKKKNQETENETKKDQKKEKIEKPKKKSPKENDQKLSIEKKKKERRDISSLVDLDDTDKIQKITERYKLLKSIFDEQPLKGRVHINDNEYKEFEIISVTIDLKNFTFRFNNSIFTSATKFIQYLFLEYTDSTTIAKPWDQIEVYIGQFNNLCQHLNLTKKEDPKWISLGYLIPTEYRRKNKKQKKNHKSSIDTADVTEIKFLAQQQSTLIDENDSKKKNNENHIENSFFQKPQLSSQLSTPTTNVSSEVVSNRMIVEKNQSIQHYEKKQNLFDERTHLIGKIVCLVHQLHTDDLQDIANSLEKLLSDQNNQRFNHSTTTPPNKINPINSVLIQKNQIMCQDFSEEEEKPISMKESLHSSNPLKGLLNPSFRTAN